MRAQVIEKDRPVSLFFNVQCKGKDELSRQNLRDKYVSVPIKVSTINYWKQQNDVTLLFVVDNQTESCYWCSPLEQVEKRFNVIQNQLTTNIHVSLDEYIDPFTISCLPQLVRSILWFMTNHLEYVNKYINEFKDGMSSEYKIDIETSVYLLKEINKSAKEIINSYESICGNLIDNIKKQIHEAYSICYTIRSNRSNDSP